MTRHILKLLKERKNSLFIDVFVLLIDFVHPLVSIDLLQLMNYCYLMIQKEYVHPLLLQFDLVHLLHQTMINFHLHSIELSHQSRIPTKIQKEYGRFSSNLMRFCCCFIDFNRSSIKCR